MTTQVLKVEVTQTDIDKGKQGRRTACPVFLALYRALKAQNEGAVAKSVMASAVSWTCNGYWWCWITSNKVKYFVRNFDAGLQCIPFEFEIPLEDVERGLRVWSWP